MVYAFRIIQVSWFCNFTMACVFIEQFYRKRYFNSVITHTHIYMYNFIYVYYMHVWRETCSFRVQASWLTTRQNHRVVNLRVSNFGSHSILMNFFVFTHIYGGGILQVYGDYWWAEKWWIWFWESVARKIVVDDKFLLLCYLRNCLSEL